MPTRPPAQAPLVLIPSAPLILPWPCLCSDNHRLMCVYGQARLSTEYRRAKQQVAERARLWWRQAATDQDVTVVGRFFFPDRRRRDAGNYRKLLTDALTGIVYVDDSQVADERWLRVGYDPEAPRVELSLAIADEREAAA